MSKAQMQIKLNDNKLKRAFTIKEIGKIFNIKDSFIRGVISREIWEPSFPGIPGKAARATIYSMVSFYIVYQIKQNFNMSDQNTQKIFKLLKSFNVLRQQYLALYFDKYNTFYCKNVASIQEINSDIIIAIDIKKMKQEALQKTLDYLNSI